MRHWDAANGSYISNRLRSVLWGPIGATKRVWSNLRSTDKLSAMNPSLSRPFLVAVNRSLDAFGLRIVAAAAGVALSVLATGCSDPAYRPDSLAIHRVSLELDEDVRQLQPRLEEVLQQRFGTLDDPKIPAAIAGDERLTQLLPLEAIRRAAGPVRRLAVGDEKIEYGLYRKHCAACHGAGGDGWGPTAATLSPYPRDFRRGTFKFGTRGPGRPPSHSDLLRTLTQGIPGTSMPAMQSLQRDAHFVDDLDVLANYVRFLSIRGETERRFWLDGVYDLDAQTATTQQVAAVVDEIIAQVAERWRAAEQAAEPIIDAEILSQGGAGQTDADRFAIDLQAAERGRQLFLSEVTGCSQCHGPNGDGRGKLFDYDEWTKDWTVRMGVDPGDREQWKPLKKLGLLKPVVDPPRNLTLGVFRGGDDPQLIFDRIANGIDGTPMPAVPRAASSPLGLTDDQIWDLVHYVLSLSSQREAESGDPHS